MQKTAYRDTNNTQSKQAASAIEQYLGPNKELYRYNKSMVEAFWPEISEFHVAWMAKVASELNLDILRGEVIWCQGRPYVTIKGLVRLLNRQANFDNYELEPVSEEIRRAMRAQEEEQVWVCRLWRRDRTRPAIGYGRATAQDTSAGYGLITTEAPEQGIFRPDSNPAYRTPAIVEMAQERAIRHAAHGAFGWELMSTLDDPASEQHKRVDPETGGVAPFLEDGSPNTVGCTASQRRCIHALVRSANLGEGKIDELTKKILEEGWRADLFRLFGKTSTMMLTVAEAQAFIETFTEKHPELEEPPVRWEDDRNKLWQDIQKLLAELPKDTPRQVCAWFRREYELEIKPENLSAEQAPARIPNSALKRLADGLEAYRKKLAPGPVS